MSEAFEIPAKTEVSVEEVSMSDRLNALTALAALGEDAPAPKRKPGRPAKVKPVSVEEAPALATHQGSVLEEVTAERDAQDAKWGTQDYPLVGSRTPGVKREQYQTAAANWQAINKVRYNVTPTHQQRETGWDGILLEEVYEALAESDPAKARAELVQVAAVAVAMIEYIDRSVQL